MYAASEHGYTHSLSGVHLVECRCEPEGVPVSRRHDLHAPAVVWVQAQGLAVPAVGVLRGAVRKGENDNDDEVDGEDGLSKAAYSNTYLEL